MSGYGKVINGGKQMQKGLTKGINDKLEEFAESHKRSASIAAQVRDVYKVNTLSDQHTQNIKGGSFQKPKVPSKV
jgi:stress response protein YsnF